MNSFTVVLDACVLYPAPLRDLLLRLALKDLYRAKWTDQILDECMRNIATQRPDLDPKNLQRTRYLMNEHVRDALVTGYESLIDGLQLPDPDDRHVLAAAIRCDADLILTFNLKDFPENKLAPYDVFAEHPDDFLVSQFGLDQNSVLEVVRIHRMSLKKPAFTAQEYLACLSRQGLTQTVELLNRYEDQI